MSWRRALTALALLTLAGPAPAAADRFAMEYEAAILNVVSLGRVLYNGAVTQAGYSVLARVETAGFAQLFDQTRISAAATGPMTPDGPYWRRYELLHHYAAKFRRVTLTRGPSGPITSAITPGYRDMGQPRVTEAQAGAARDPVTSLAALGVAVAQAGACAGRSRTFDGRNLYDLVLSPGGPDRSLRAGGYDGPVRVCQLRYVPIAGYPAGRMPPPGRIPTVEIWFAAAPPGARFAPPVRMQVPTPAGAAVLTLRSYSFTPG